MATPPLRKPGVLTRWIDPIHRWTGAVIGVLLAVMGLSGTLLIHEDAWLRATVPHAADARAPDPTAYGAALERLMSAGPARPANVIFPSDSLGVFTLSFGEGAGAYADASGAIVSRWETKWERPEVWLFDLHHHWFMGDVGTTGAGILALTGLGFVVTGILLWWRNRRNFKLRAWPSSMTRLQIVRHHRDLGLVMSPLLLVVFLTGSMLVFRPIAQALFAPLSPGSITASLEQPKEKGGRLAGNLDWRGLLQVVRTSYPDGQLRGISVPRREGQLIRVRVKQPGEWLPNGRTMLWFDPANGRLIDSRDAMTLPRATRAYNAVFPIHASKIGGELYKLVMTAAGLTLTMLGSLAVYAFWGFRMRRERAAAASAGERVAG